MRTRTSWQEKMPKPAEPELVDIPQKMTARFGTGSMLIPTPRLIDGLVRRVPEGQVVTITQIRDHLARDFQAGTTCPLTTGIFLRIAAEAALEQLNAGAAGITPCWRVVRDDGSLLDKFPGGPDAQAAFLTAEGLALLPGRGKKPPRVNDLAAHLVALKPGNHPATRAGARPTWPTTADRPPPAAP